MAKRGTPPIPTGKLSRKARSLRSDGRRHDTGRIRPYRPCPDDFAETYIAMGQGKEIEEHYHTNWRVIARWIEESGGETLREQRYEASGGFARPEKRSKLTAVSRRRRKA